MKKWSRPQCAAALVAWSIVSIVLVWVDAPTWLRLPIVGVFSLIGFGLVVVLALRIRSVPLGFAITIAVGVSCLILCSETVLYTRGFSAMRTLLLQSVLLWIVAVWVARREIAAWNREHEAMDRLLRRQRTEAQDSAGGARS